MNHLQYESSPYLLQHAHNPVDWYAWKPEAFERARAENKPVLVSIGYSTCHWCHVMERESFENPDIAAFMNERYINIKVDREERPDVDAIYMEACQILTGGGGWPLHCFLTPEGKPFFAGTYYPPRPAHNRPSWLQVLQHLANIWETKRASAYEQADKLLGYIQRNDNIFLEKPASELALQSKQAFPPTLLENIFYQMREQFDRVEGGFGGAPKFPSTMAIQYLLNYHWFTRNRNTEALEQALLSLDKMVMGGIYDQIGGGFARYATDREWLAPHFEKMLYDNALLVTVLADACKLLRTPGVAAGQQMLPRVNLYRETIEETLAFVHREMTHPQGGFYSAQDADSEGEEGKFYVWTHAEVTAILGADAALFCAFYDVTPAGNWEHKNILRRTVDDEVFAAQHKISVESLRERLQKCRKLLFHERSKRIPPGLDDKVISGWNALMVSAYTHAFAALGVDSYREAAVKNIEFVLGNMTDESDGRLFHTWKDDRVQHKAVLEDYALLIAALLDVWQITFNFRYLTLAERYTEQVYQYFHDSESGLFFFSASDQTDIILRKKDLYDNATPSGNSTMVHNLQRLGILLDRREWRDHAAQMLTKMQVTVERYPLSFERWALALVYEVHPYLEIAVVGSNALEKAQAIQNRFLPNMALTANREGENTLPLLAGKSGAEDALIYVCQDYACQAPMQTLEDFDQFIRTS
ncbi:MAG: thioredoxin domain-containing protein [Lewinellaceae bacterium]|nr:thioredoxin domain-containing protein [Lewinellaceae bacterium]